MVPRGLGNKSGGKFMKVSIVFKQGVSVIHQTGIIQGIRCVWLQTGTAQRTAGFRALLDLIHLFDSGLMYIYFGYS